MSEVLEHYMHHSEQLDTRLWLAANGERAVGVLLQKLPGDDGIVPHASEHNADTWQRVCHLGSTLSTDELLKEEPETVFRRLFWQENVRHFEPTTARFQCTCSREKVGSMLKMLGCEEVDGVIAGSAAASRCTASSAISAMSSIRSPSHNFLSQTGSHRE